MLAGSCNLDYHPKNNANEFNYIDEGGDTDSQYKTREDILGALNGMYVNIKSEIQEKGYMDLQT